MISIIRFKDFTQNMNSARFGQLCMLTFFFCICFYISYFDLSLVILLYFLLFFTHGVDFYLSSKINE